MASALSRCTRELGRVVAGGDWGGWHWSQRGSTARAGSLSNDNAASGGANARTEKLRKDEEGRGGRSWRGCYGTSYRTRPVSALVNVRLRASGCLGGTPTFSFCLSLLSRATRSRSYFCPLKIQKMLTRSCSGSRARRRILGRPCA